MFRSIESDLLTWKNQQNRKPLLVRGARQVGKTYVVEKFGKINFEQLVSVNFEFEPKFIDCFKSLDPLKITQTIEAITEKKITPGKTLLFLDEIQECPAAIQALRYFKEKMPELHVIGAGSFLEFVICDESYQQPVGRVESLYIKPCSFKEFLIASGKKNLLDLLSTATLKKGIAKPIHELLLEKCREYFILGGMPEVIDHFLKTKKYLGCEKIQASILEYYRRDLAKYNSRINTRILEKFFVKAPGLIAKRFKFSDIDPEIQAREQKPILEALIKAGIIYPNYQTSASGLPFQVGMNEKKFKLLFLDIGLAKHTMSIDIETLFHEQLTLINQGALTEQFVGQELLAYNPSYEEAKLFYWERDKKNSQAEVDYVINVGPNIYPIEVKSGKTGRLKSLQVFLDEKNTNLAIRISQHQLSFDQRVLSIPLYMVSELPRLIKEYLTL